MIFLIALFTSLYVGSFKSGYMQQCSRIFFSTVLSCTILFARPIKVCDIASALVPLPSSGHCFKGSDGKIYSGRVYAHESEGWQYGYIEARMMLPKGKGTWPAFWMMPCNVDWSKEGWPKCGEIDIMEEVGVVPNEVSSSLHAEGHITVNQFCLK